MNRRIVITGTDTEIGKTAFSAALMLGLEQAGENPHYWKPIQSGVEDIVDTRTVQTLSNLPQERFLPEQYILSEPLSPHRSAEIDDVVIDTDALYDPMNIPTCDGTLIIEGAGGLMVPLTRENLQVNMYKSWCLPVVLCARTGLGTINHTLLSLEALWSRRIRVMGIVFIGDENTDNMRTIEEFSGVKTLGHFPTMPHMDDTSLRMMFANNFNARDFSVLDIVK